MKIGEIASKTGLSIETIRFYEKTGLIQKVDRSENGYREYGDESVAALQFIAHCRSLDIPIPSIKKLLKVRAGTTKSCRDANVVITEELENLRERIRQLRRLEKSLSQLQAVCNRELKPEECEIIRGIQAMDP